MMKKLGIYIHLPFCVSKCQYCDFYSVVQGESKMDAYQTALVAHIKTLAPSAQGYQVDTIYFGGGTPTLYGAARVEGLLRTLKKHYRVERDAEITLEGNPESLTPSLVQGLKRSGINRFSLGMQSAQGEELKNIGRPHSAQQTREGVAILKKQQVKNLSLDLIYGLPGQTQASWSATLEEAIALEPQHLSCYGLKVEEGTPLAQRVAQGEELPDEDVQADLYLWTVERLAQAGYHQYEISNFAQKGYHSKHNLGYWLGKPYLGFGASASSDFGGYRYTLVADIAQYGYCVLEGAGEIFTSNQLMSPRERGEEYLMLRLRTVEGICVKDYEKICQKPFAPIFEQCQRFLSPGWMAQQGERWYLTPEGMLRSNQIIGLLLEAQEAPLPEHPPSVVVEEGAPTAGITGPTWQEEENGQFRLL